MNIRRKTLGNIALQMLFHAIDEDGGLGCVRSNIESIEAAELALYFERALATGAKRVQIDLTGDMR